VIVKPVWEHGSLGLDETSVVHCADAPGVVAARTLSLNTEHFAETYIEGREFHVALLERIWGTELLPIAEILFAGFELHAPKIYGYDGKWSLFTDIRLPEGDLAGLELAQKARELNPSLKVLYTTGQTVTDGMKSMFVEGSHFLTKPYTVNEMTRAFKEVLA
jgi:DNA-binding LytR/AlgR family response regulator